MGWSASGERHPRLTSPARRFSGLLPALVLASVFLLLAQPAAAQTTIWSMTLTVDEDAGVFGCDNSRATQDNCSAALTDDDFMYGGVSYQVTRLTHFVSSGAHVVRLTTNPGAASRLAGLELHLGTTRLFFGSTATGSFRWNFGSTATGNNVNPLWTDNQQVAVRLVDPRTNANLSALTAKSATGAMETFSALALSPSNFSAATTAYTASVASNITHVKLTPRRAHIGASIKVGKGTNLSAVNTSTDSAAISLSVGANTILVEVTAADGTTKNTYTVSVTRASAPTTPPTTTPPTTTTTSPESIWAATLTVDVDGSSDFYGCDTSDPGQDDCSPAANLTDNDFTYKGLTYFIEDLYWRDSTDSLIIEIKEGTNDFLGRQVKAAFGSWTLIVDGTEFTISSGVANLVSLSWPYNPNPAWVEGQTVSVSLSAPTVSLSATPARVPEGGVVTVTVTLPEMAAAEGGVDVPITLTAGTAEPGDYGTLTTINVPTNSTSATGTFTTAQDEDTDDETLTVALGSSLPSSWIAGSASSVAITIIDDDVSPVSALAEQLHRAVLPEVARAVADRTTQAISARVGRVHGNGSGGDTASASLGGQHTLASALTTHAADMANGRRDLRDLLSGSGFVLPLSGYGDGGGSRSPSLWASGDYRNLSGEDGDLEFDGSLHGVQIGVDAMVRDNMLAGLALSWSEGDLQYEGGGGIGGASGQGDYELDVISFHPYLGGSSGRLDWWATLGYGSGEVEITPETGEAASNDVSMTTLGAGGSGLLWSRAEDGARVHLKGEFTSTRMDVERSAQVDSLSVDANLARIALAASRTRSLAGGGSLSPSLSLGARHDGGDGNTGTGAEVSANLRYDNAESGVSTSISAHGLFGRSDYEEWGVQALVRLSAGADGQGLSFVMSPGYGNNGGGDGNTGQIWSNGLRGDHAPTARDASGRLEMRMGYGLSSSGGRDGLLTPWGGLNLENNGKRYRLGLDWASGGPFTLRLHGERRESASAGVDADHAVLLRGEARF